MCTSVCLITVACVMCAHDSQVPGKGAGAPIAGDIGSCYQSDMCSGS